MTGHRNYILTDSQCNNKQFLYPEMHENHHKNIQLNNIRVNEKLNRDTGYKCLFPRLDNAIQFNSLTNEPQLRRRVSSLTYGDLSDAQKIALRVASCSAFVKKRKPNWIPDCFSKTEPIIEGKKVNAHVFEVISFLQDKGKHCKYIFRVEGDIEISSLLADELSKGNMVPLSECNVLEIASALKAYIRDTLNGIVPIEVANRMFYALKHNMYLEKVVLSSYMPFVFTSVERELLRAIFRLISLIDENKETTLMSSDSSLKLFSLVLFPREAFSHLDNLSYVGTITRELFEADIDVLPSGYLV